MKWVCLLVLVACSRAVPEVDAGGIDQRFGMMRRESGMTTITCHPDSGCINAATGAPVVLPEPSQSDTLGGGR